MKRSLITLSILIIGALILWQCQRTTYTKSNFPENRLSFGSGGGFSGAVTTFHLLPNGEIFKSEGLQADTTLLSSIKKSQANKFFKQIEEMEFMSIDFNHPGNIYKFIGFHTEEGENQVTWGGTDVEIFASIEDLYKDLNDLTTPKASK